MEGNLRFTINWVSLQLEGNFPFLVCFTLNFRANPKYKPQLGLYSEGQFNGGFFVLHVFGGHTIFGEACTWTGLFSEFYSDF